MILLFINTLKRCPGCMIVLNIWRVLMRVVMISGEDVALNITDQLTIDHSPHSHHQVQHWRTLEPLVIDEVINNVTQVNVGGIVCSPGLLQESHFLMTDDLGSGTSPSLLQLQTIVNVETWV